eukprot:GHVU01191031.1.p1 GENE.GHVU01191031.1~~GHVU01191031.1.p1  ORF type:complete len:130 (+),score=0.83 GHVU01191031.1:34-423(+)
MSLSVIYCRSASAKDSGASAPLRRLNDHPGLGCCIRSPQAQEQNRNVVMAGSLRPEIPCILVLIVLEFKPIEPVSHRIFFNISTHLSYTKLSLFGRCRFSFDTLSVNPDRISSRVDKYQHDLRMTGVSE